MAVAGRAATAAAPRRRRSDRFRAITTVVSLVAPVALLAIIVVIGSAGLPALRQFGVGFLTSRAWNPVTDQFGALPFIYGTLVTSAIALLLATPVGVGVAIFLAEPGAPRLRGAIGTGVELLAAIPSVVYGIWGLYVLAPWLLLHVSRPLSERMGGIPLLAAPARQTNLLVASLVLSVMVLPTLSSIAREVIRAVPVGMREASVALGATWWETMWKVVRPAARAGISAATILALGRARGETIAVTTTIGTRPDIPASLLSPAYTLASVIANEFAEATGTIYPSALVLLGLVLVLVTLSINVLALLLVGSVSREARV